ncbi:N-acetylmuramoyl-L-alanine amidase family protein [Arcobacter arenosus]|uniref:N-acetylmuramoyl-L-alanine amidase n=1 Tax=Arcobacter arenosus TaxID=2576037 RepID=A0A5R8Y5A9_9BACT|nr:N-acetylmuramoyl-L-alanine amidase [Arcobacter arenosus]TLP41021.1 N-acetylmuramoyl-L-alanine amidase [Arcobacter arenosus]
MKRIAIVVGHSVWSKGAYNENLNLHEFYLNDVLAKEIKNALSLNDDFTPYLVYRKNGYAKLPNDINHTSPDIIISVHHNSSANKNVQGTETLYYHKSTNGKDLATLVQNKMLEVLEFRDRGIKAVDSEDRGGYVLRYTNAPMILIEPYFMSDDDGVAKGTKLNTELAMAIREGIEEYLK